MTATFILTIDTDGDTDLPSIANDIRTAVEHEFSVLSVHPWARPTLAASQAPPDVSGQQRKT